MNIKLKMVVFISVTTTLYFSSNAAAAPPKGRLNVLEAAVVALQAENAAQQAVIADLQSRLSAVEANTALQMDGYVIVDNNTINGAPGPHVIFQGVNVHIQNGEGSTRSSGGGLGNLIVGYNEEPRTLEPGERGGSHNLILGRTHKYLAAGGIANGWGAELRANAAVALAADENVIDRSYSASIGGWGNHIINRGVTIGGRDNTIYGNRSVIVGGQNNTTGEIDTTLGLYATIVGGLEHIATGDYSNISGGYDNHAVGDYSAISGGVSSSTHGAYSAFSGGSSDVIISDDYGWGAGDLRYPAVP
jgi:hypothetical protein